MRSPAGSGEASYPKSKRRRATSGSSASFLIRSCRKAGSIMGEGVPFAFEGVGEAIFWGKGGIRAKGDSFGMEQKLNLIAKSSASEYPAHILLNWPQFFAFFMGELLPPLWVEEIKERMAKEGKG
ncbi:MAG: hypothetical protein ACUVQS_05385 [Candidatus Bipolaricaulaceae bacterium]